jgi:hypothetical protein
MGSVFEEIEDLIWEDAGGRGLTAYAQCGELEGASVSLLTANHVIIVTGFYIEKTRSGETDGPLGTIILASALEKLGVDVTLLTNHFNGEILIHAAQQLGLSGGVIVIDKGDEAVIFPKLLADTGLTHIVAIEQMGSSIDGKYYNMFGTDLSHSTVHFDSLFLLAREKGIVTIGIGDGGNEIGMGKLYATLCEKDGYGRVSCITPTDYLIVAGISNWGAYGLVAGLSYLARRSLLHHPEQEKELLEAVIQAGAVDGRTFESALSVDALPVTKHMEVVDELLKIYDRFQMGTGPLKGGQNVG